MSEQGQDDVEALKAEVARLRAAQSAPQPLPPLQPVQGGGGGGLIGLLIALVVLCAAAAVAYYFASPLLALDGLRSAAKSGDRDRLAQLVDFPVLRENLKSELSAKMLKVVRDDPDMRDNPYAGLGAVFAPIVVDKLVDAYVTPDTISAMVESGKAPAPSSAGGAPAAPSAAQPAPRSPPIAGRIDLAHSVLRLHTPAA
jgi:hypothetical protein